MASPAETYDIDRELEVWLEKQAAEQGVDLHALRQQELEAWNRWKQNPNPQDFEWLYNSHKPLIYNAAQRYLNSTTLPKAAVQSDVLRQYISALDSFDPSKASFSTHLNHHMQHTGRYLTKYQNTAKIPEDRAQMIGLFQNRLANLKEQLGREPSNAELADDMRASMAEVAELSKAANKITARTVGTLRQEMRRDLLGEAPGGEVHTESSRMLDHLIFLHGSLSPEQQVVLEHTFEGFGKPVVEDAMQLGPVINMSPQKIRAIRKQIADKVKRYY